MRRTYGYRLDLAVVDRGTDDIVGEVVLNQWDAGNRCVNFRTLLGPTARGRGLGTEAANLALNHAFAVAGVYRVELEVYAFNP